MSDAATTLALDVALPLRRFELRVKLETSARALAVLGHSGAGKTSLLEAICGLRPARGRIATREQTLLDSEAGVRAKPEHRRVGYVPQDAMLFPHLSARDNVCFGLRGADAAKRLDAVVALTEVGPVLDQFPATLSGGERQRVALARALATQPQLLLLDEPLAALDVELKQRLLPYLLRVRDEARVPLVYVTHHWGEARLLAEDALVLKDGAVAASGPAKDVLAPHALSVLGPLPEAENVVRGRLESYPSGMLLSLTGGDVLHVPGSPEDAGRLAVYGVPADDILVSAHPLEAVSARNVLKGTVVDLTEMDADVLARIRAGSVEWLAKLTQASVSTLALTPGGTVHLAIKTHSFRRLR